MVSTRTINRIKKVNLLKESLNGIIDLLLMDFKSRDVINMAEFKHLSSKVKEMLEQGKLFEKKFTYNSKT